MCIRDSVYADIEGLVFHSLESLNAAISESLSAFNGRRMSCLLYTSWTKSEGFKKGNKRNSNIKNYDYAKLVQCVICYRG